MVFNVSSTEGRSHEASSGWGGMRFLRVWLAITPPGGRRAAAPEYYGSGPVRPPLKAKAVTPRGAPQGAGASRKMRQGPARNRVSPGLSNRAGPA